MKKESILLVLFAILIITSCKFTDNKEIVSSEFKIIPIERLKGEKYMYNMENGEQGEQITETVFILNPPTNQDSLINIMLKWREKEGLELNRLYMYVVRFYKYDSSSSVYLAKDYRNDENGITYSLLEDNKYRIGAIYVEPCLTDSEQWIVSISVSKKDEKREYYIEDSYYSVLDSCATLVNNKLILSTSIQE